MFRILTLGIVASLFYGIFSFVVQMMSAGTTQKTFAFHYTVYLGIDDVRTLGWLMVWPTLWLVTSLFFLVCGYGAYRRDAHAGYAWLVLGATSTLPWLLALRYLALINR